MRIYDIAAPFVDADRQDIFGLLLRQYQEPQYTQMGTVLRVKRVRKIRRHGERGTLRCD